jgi:hypothetical protein
MILIRVGISVSAGDKTPLGIAVHGDFYQFGGLVRLSRNGWKDKWNEQWMGYPPFLVRRNLPM